MECQSVCFPAFAGGLWGEIRVLMARGVSPFATEPIIGSIAVQIVFVGTIERTGRLRFLLNFLRHLFSPCDWLQQRPVGDGKSHSQSESLIHQLSVCHNSSRTLES